MPNHDALPCLFISSTPHVIPLQGLNASHMVAAVFDPVRLYRGYAVTDDGDLLALIVPHDARASTCKVGGSQTFDRGRPDLWVASQFQKGSL